MVRFQLIRDWKKSYKLYSMWVSIGIMVVSVIDVLLQAKQLGEVPKWVFYATGPGMALARVIHQFMGEPDGDE